MMGPAMVPGTVGQDGTGVTVRKQETGSGPLPRSRLGPGLVSDTRPPLSGANTAARETEIQPGPCSKENFPVAHKENSGALQPSKGFLFTTQVSAQRPPQLQYVDPVPCLWMLSCDPPDAHQAGPPPSLTLRPLSLPPTPVYACLNVHPRGPGMIHSRQRRDCESARVDRNSLSDAGAAGNPPHPSTRTGRWLRPAPAQGRDAPAPRLRGSGDPPHPPMSIRCADGHEWGGGGVPCLPAPVSRADGQGKVGDPPNAVNRLTDKYECGSRHHTSHQPLKSASRECRLTKGSLCARHPECVLLAPGGPSPDSAQRCGYTGPAEARPLAGGLTFLQSGRTALGAPTFCCVVCPAATEHPQAPGESPGGSEPVHSVPRMLRGEKALQSTDCARQEPWLRARCRLLPPAQDQNGLSPHSQCQPGRPHRMMPLASCKKVLCHPDPVETALPARHLCSSCISSRLAHRGHLLLEGPPLGEDNAVDAAESRHYQAPVEQVSPHTGPGAPPVWLDDGGPWFPWNEASPPGVPCWLHVLPHKSPFAKGVQRCLSSRATSAATVKVPAAADVGDALTLVPAKRLGNRSVGLAAGRHLGSRFPSNAACVAPVAGALEGTWHPGQAERRPGGAPEGGSRVPFLCPLSGCSREEERGVCEPLAEALLTPLRGSRPPLCVPRARQRPRVERSGDAAPRSRLQAAPTASPPPLAGLCPPVDWTCLALPPLGTQAPLCARPLCVPATPLGSWPASAGGRRRTPGRVWEQRPLAESPNPGGGGGLSAGEGEPEGPTGRLEKNVRLTRQTLSHRVVVGAPQGWRTTDGWTDRQACSASLSTPVDWSNVAPASQPIAQE
uniref:Uncharacterized protein n=1 Tax=Rangifer tarandus platyrhynchus TaxID=3082113 RepID=A0ACB0E5W9_RANTA|nr:unnamed protein product [Rangifer tarandus platyrhynchus]